MTVKGNKLDIASLRKKVYKKTIKEVLKMTYKWVYDLNKKELYKTKKESIEINNSDNDILDISYSDKRVVSKFYTLARANDCRFNLHKGLLFINNLDSTLTRIILRRNRF